MKPNIIFYFSDQQRADTLNPEIMPNVCDLAEEGVCFSDLYTCQLDEGTRTPAHIFSDNGYDTAYIGKWHLASDRFKGFGVHCETTAIPKNRQGGYDYLRAADILEFTSHGYDGYVFDENAKRIDFTGYRADCINDFAIEYINNHSGEKPFFMFISQLEPHHQNDHGHFEGPKETIEKYKDYPIPESYSGKVLPVNGLDSSERDCVFVQISESHVGRCVRTKKWKYSARAKGSGNFRYKAKTYYDDCLYDLENDKYEKHNLVNNKEYEDVIIEMRSLLVREMVRAGEKAPVFKKPRKAKEF